LLLPGKRKRRFADCADQSGGGNDHCLFIQRFEDPTLTEWKQKKEPLFDIVECLSDEAVKAWEEHYSNEDAYYEEDDD
jgi:hypothetical protein